MQDEEREIGSDIQYNRDKKKNKLMELAQILKGEGGGTTRRVREMGATSTQKEGVKSWKQRPQLPENLFLCTTALLATSVNNRYRDEETRVHGNGW